MGEFTLQKFLTIMFILVVGFFVTWLSLSTGEEVLTTAPNSKLFNPAGDELAE